MREPPIGRPGGGIGGLGLAIVQRIAALHGGALRALPAPPAAVLARLRLPDGTTLTPTLRPLADPGVEGMAPYRALAIDAVAGGDDRISLWACSVTRDGWPGVNGLGSR